MDYNLLLNKYGKYIINNKIENYEIQIFTLKYSYCIDKFKIFIDKYSYCNNITYIYFKGLYYILLEKYDDMLILFANTNTNDKHILALIGYYYQYISYNYDEMKKYYIKAIEMGNTKIMLHFMLYCINFEHNFFNYYKYLYFPRLLTLILCCKRANKNKAHNTNKCNEIIIDEDTNINLFLPEELLKSIIFEEFISL